MIMTVWVELLSWLRGELIELVALFVALIALVIAFKEKHLAITSTKSHALLFWVTNIQDFGYDSCRLSVCYEARGPIPYHDIRVCVWGKNNEVTQADEQLVVLSSADGRQISEVELSYNSADIAYIGLVWSEPHGEELITLGRRVPLASTISQGTEYWKWTPWFEKFSLGFFSGRWKKTSRGRWMLLKRDIGPTK